MEKMKVKRLDRDPAPFLDLPAALVEEILDGTKEVGHQLLVNFQEVKSHRRDRRAALENSGLILREADLGYPPIPTTCGADGSYMIERLLSTDLTAAAAVAVEGLTPPSEKRYWEQPRHSTFIGPEAHHEETASVLRAVMLGHELLLATKAPHDVIMLDGTLTLPTIYFNQALNASADAPSLCCSEEFRSQCCDFLQAYAEILESKHSDKQYAAFPKYSTRREMGKRMEWPLEHDDRGLLTFLLEPGEFTRPIALEQPDAPWHMNINRLPGNFAARAKDLRERILSLLKSVHVFYYKPQTWLPALRIEVAESTASNHHRMAIIVQGVKHQCAIASTLEPYPLYLADRMVKALARAMPAFRQITTRQISETYDGDIGEIFFAMHGYRTEQGR